MPISLYLIWFLIGIGFLIGEMMVPGFILIFFMAGSWVVAASVFFFAELALTTQLIIFIISSLVLLFSLRRYGLRTFKGESKTGVDEEFSKVGEKAVVTKAIPQNDYGEIRLDGTFWRATAEVSIAKDQRVVVEGSEPTSNMVLRVKPCINSTESHS